MRLVTPHDSFEPDDMGPGGHHGRMTRAKRIDYATAMLSVTGELDSAAYEPIRDALLALEGHRAQMVVIDLSEVTFMTCAGIRLIVEAQERADLGGWSVVVIAPTAPADLVLNLTGLDEELNVMRSPRSARSARSESPPDEGPRAPREMAE